MDAEIITGLGHDLVMLRIWRIDHKAAGREVEGFSLMQARRSFSSAMINDLDSGMGMHTATRAQTDGLLPPSDETHGLGGVGQKIMPGGVSHFL